MRVLVTGASGFAGRHLLDTVLATGGAEVTAAALHLPADPREREAYPGVRWLPLDVGSLDSLREVVRESRPERVFHLAGQASVGYSFEAPVETWDTNATGTLRLFAALEAEGVAGARVLLVSSAEVYGAVPGSAQPIRESHPAEPITPYGASKAAAETAALQMARAGVAEVVIARSFNHIGPGQEDRFVLPSLARQLVEISRGEREPVVQVGNLDVERDFLDVRDVAKAYARILEAGENGGVYNVCSGVVRPLAEVVDRLVEISGTGARLRVDPERVRAVDIPRLLGDSSRLRSLGWEPEIGLERSLRDLLRETEARR